MSESLNGGFANGGLRSWSAIVHDCLKLPSFCDENSLYERPRKCTIIHDCAQIAESGLKPLFFFWEPPFGLSWTIARDRSPKSQITSDFPSQPALQSGFLSRSDSTPKGPKIEKIQDRPLGLKFSSKIENFKQATHQSPIFAREFWRSGLQFSIEIEKFKRDWIFSIFGPLGVGMEGRNLQICAMHLHMQVLLTW